MRPSLVAILYLFAVAAGSSQPALQVTVEQTESDEFSLGDMDSKDKASNGISSLSDTEVVSMTGVDSAIPDRIEAHAESETDDGDWRSVASQAEEKTAHITLLVKWESSRQVISREIANARDLRDMSFIPNESDDLGDLTPMGKIVSVATLATTGDSVLREVVLESEPEKKLVAKYTNDCSQKLMEPWGGDLHPLVSEYAFLMVTNATGITPNVYYLSPETKLVSDLSSKSKSSVFSEHAAYCLDKHASLRLMVLDKVGVSIEDYLGWLRANRPGDSARDYLLAVLRFGKESIRLIWQLHEMGLLHGDIHGKNIMLKKPKGSMAEYDWKNDDLVLIDLGFARFFPDEIGTVELRGYIPGLNLFFLSPWHIRGNRIGRRDDLFRVLEMMASLLSDGKLDEGIIAIYKRAHRNVVEKGNPFDKHTLQADVLYNYKTSCNLFLFDNDLRSSTCENMGLKLEEKTIVQTRLEKMKNDILAIDSVDSIPQYGYFISEIESIEQSITRGR